MTSDSELTTPTEKPEPTLVLMRGNALTVEGVRAMFEQLAGRAMTREEVESLRQRLSRE